MLKQTLSQKLLQKLSPQQIQLMKLLQLPTVALEQRIKEEMEINPALDEGPDDEEDEIKDQDESETAEDQDEEERSDKDDYETPPYKLKVNNTSPDDERREVPLSVSYSFHDLLDSQLGLRPLTDHQYQVASYLIGNIDDDGYLRRDLDSIVDDIAVSQNISTTKEELEELLKLIQEFDPAGVGARDLKECLLLQLERITFADEIIQLAIEVD